VVWPWDIPANELRARGTDLLVVVVAAAPLAFARAVPARAPDAKPDGRVGCNTSAQGCDGSVRSALHSPGDRSKKIPIRWLGADPRWFAPGMGSKNPVPQGAFPGRGLRVDVRRIDSDTDGIDPGAFPVHSGSDDIVGWRAFAAIAELRPGIRDCNIELGGGWDERASRTP
jgi:hypothetical protein